MDETTVTLSKRMVFDLCQKQKVGETRNARDFSQKPLRDHEGGFSNLEPNIILSMVSKFTGPVLLVEFFFFGPRLPSWQIAHILLHNIFMRLSPVIIRLFISSR